MLAGLPSICVWPLWASYRQRIRQELGKPCTMRGRMLFSISVWDSISAKPAMHPKLLDKELRGCESLKFGFIPLPRF